MNRLLLILILTISFQTLIKADDIHDFQIENIGIGDNLIDHMTKKEIINNDQGHYPKNSKFFEVNYTGIKNQYDYVNFGVKRNDNNFKIYYIRGMNVVDNKSECIKTKNKIAKDLEKLFPNTYFQEGSQKHYFYKNSTQYTFRKKAGMLITAITSFSSKPLVGIFYLGFLITFFSSLAAIFIIFKQIFFQHAMSGWASVIVSIWFLSGVIIFFIGTVGIYISKIFSEVKDRPYTIIKKVYKNTYG